MSTTISPDELKKQVREEAASLAQAVEEASSSEEKSDVFFKGIRESCIPYLPCMLRNDPEQLYVRSYEALYTLAYANLPLAVGFAMHQYNLAALATLPVKRDHEFENRRKILVDSVERYRSLIAISSFGANIRAKGAVNPNVTIYENENGEFVCNGKKNFQSMATKADILLFSGHLPDDSMGLFYCQLAGQKNITVGDSLFPGAMSLTDTKPIFMNNVVLKRRNMLALEEWLTYFFSNYSTSWFEGLMTAAYLGGAGRALEEVRRFGRSVSHDQEKLLSELDGFVLDVGRLAAKHRSAVAFGMSFGVAAARFCQAVISEAPEEVETGLMYDVMDVSSAIKYSCTAIAQEIVNGARGLIGSRSMHTSHPIHALTEQICFGPLHPTIPAHYEREAGEELLGEEPYAGLFDWCFG